MQDADFRTCRGKIRVNAGAFRACEELGLLAGHASRQEDLATGPARKREPTTAGPCNMGRLPLSELAAKVGRVQFSCMAPPAISVSAHQGLS